MKHSLLRLSVLALLLMIKMAVFGQSEFEVDGIKYVFTSEETVSVVSNNYSGDIIIPEHIVYNGTTYSVTSIGYRAFYRCFSSLTSVTIPNSVTSIGDDAFGSCKGLTSVIIPNSVTSIGARAFINCSGLTSVIIPNSVTSIGGYAFSGCSSLTSVSIGNSVTSIGAGAFSKCSGLTSVIIPNSVTSIGDGAFSYCSGLTSVTVPNSVTTIGSSAFSGCSGLTSLTIPNSVTTIGSSAFSGCSGLTSLTIPNSVTTIGSSAFYECSGLTSLTIPNSVTAIGVTAFYGCRSLLSVLLNCKEIGSWFSGITSINEVVLGDSVTSIDNNAFRDCSGLTSVTIPNSVTSIGRSAFYNCSGLTSVTIPNSVTSIGISAFYGCNLTTMTIPNSVTSLGGTLPSSLKDIDFGNGIDSLDYSVFSNLNNLQSVKFGEKTRIISAALFNCDSLKGIKISAIQPPRIDYSNYYSRDIKNTSILIQPIKEGLPLYTKDDFWSVFRDIFIVEGTDTLVAIPFIVSNNNITITNSIYLSDDGAVVRLNNEAIIKCNNSNSFVSFRGKDISKMVSTGYSFMPSINYRNNIVYLYNLIGEDVWNVNIKNAGTLIDEIGVENVEKVKSLIISGNINGTDVLAIRKMKNLNLLDLENVNIVEGGMTYFKDFKTENNVVTSYFVNETLKAVRLPKSAIKITDNAFYKCEKLQVVIFGENIKKIGHGAFEFCNSLTSVDFGQHELIIGHMAFYNCKNLCTLTIPNTIRFNGLSAFAYLPNLTELHCDVVRGEYQYTPEAQFEGVYNNLEYSYINIEDIYWNCSVPNLKTLVIGDSVRSILQGFGSTRLESLHIGKNVKLIYPGAFKNCKCLKTLYIPQNVRIVDGSFIGCSNLENIIIENGVESIQEAFAGCTSLEKLSLPISITNIEGAFNGCSNLRKIILPNDLHEIGSYTFKGCTNLNEINMPDSLEIIGESSFYKCESLTEFVIPQKVEQIGSSAFVGCSNISTIYSLNPIPPEVSSWSKTFEDNVVANATLYVPKGSKTLYWLHPYWEKFNNIVELDESGINDVKLDVPQMSKGVYTIDGVKVSANADNIESLPKGIYIVNGEKVIIK